MGLRHNKKNRRLIAGGFSLSGAANYRRFYFRFNCEISRTAPRSADVANAA
jgi:hypothetical protein